MLIIVLFIQFAISCLVNTYLISKKALTRFKWVFSLIFGIVLIILYKFMGLYTSFIMFIFFMGMNYKITKKWSESISTGAITMIITILADHVVSFVLYSGYVFSLSPVNIESCTFLQMTRHLGSFFLVCMVLAKTWNKMLYKIKSRKDIEETFTWILAVFASFTYSCYFLSVLLVRSLGDQNKMVILNGFFLIIYFLIFLISLFFLLNSQKKKYEIKQQEIEYKNLQTYTESLEQSYTEMRIFRHDYINILASMSEYISNRDIESLDTYFNDNIMKVSAEIQLNNFKLNCLKNVKIPEIKGLLSSKLIVAQEKGIDIAFEAMEIIEKIHMDNVAFCRCLGILLDNAIEEAVNINNSKVHVAFINYENSLSFIVMNTYFAKEYKVFQYFEKGFSTKGENRGMGLSNLKQIIDKVPNSQLDTNITNGNFIQEIKIIKKGE